jgi:hypothetical protein
VPKSGGGMSCSDGVFHPFGSRRCSRRQHLYDDNRGLRTYHGIDGGTDEAPLVRASRNARLATSCLEAGGRRCDESHDEEVMMISQTYRQRLAKMKWA